MKVLYVLLSACNSDICQLAADAGPCLAGQTRYFYDPNRRSCRQFTYGGCLGNENNFASAESCERHCVDIASRPSDEPVTKRPDSKFKIWYTSPNWPVIYVDRMLP